MCGNESKTLSLQVSYDTKLNNATYDALKAFQLNTFNSDTSDIANSKLRDIEASANTFFTSIASNFNMAGYNQDIIKEYVPALVYTMYDGYYIYTPYTNKLDENKTNEVINEETGMVEKKSDKEILDSNADSSYKDGEKIFGLKPYIFYSCRYKRGADDFVITYSLDNYITIKGIINNNAINDSGYLIDSITKTGEDIFYRNVQISNDDLPKETVCDPENGEIGKYQYVKINGVKYYKNDSTNKWFAFLNNEKNEQGELDSTKVEQAKKFAKNYYKEAKEFTKRIRDTYNLKELKGTDAVDENGNPLFDKDKDGNNTSQYKLGNYNIFKFDSNKNIEDPDSNFNQQRLAVIRYAIEKNLSIAINNYNHYSDTITANFQMPELKENEWEKIINNVSIISFLQGLNIGGKVYNGYSIITNNKNNEVVNEDSIYIVTQDERRTTISQS